MSIEYNSHLPLGSTAIMSPGYGWNGYDAFYGSSAGICLNVCYYW